MTEADKARLVSLRQQGKGCAEIARLMNLSVNTVKSFLQRNRVGVETVSIVTKRAVVPERTAVQKGYCKQCGTPIRQTEHSREKQFCSDKCRMQWWHAHRDTSKGAIERICPACQKVFSTDRLQKYCCHECYILSRFGRKKNI